MAKLSAEMNADIDEIMDDLGATVRIRGELVYAVVGEETRAAEIDDAGAFSTWERELFVKGMARNDFKVGEAVHIGDQTYAIDSVRPDGVAEDVVVIIQRRDTGSVA